MYGIGGLTAEEAVEIGLLCGRQEKVRVIDITEFNPRIEDYRTGKLAASIFYYYLLGMSTRK